MVNRDYLVIASFITLCTINNLRTEQDITPYFSIRSQGRNSARFLSGWVNQTHKVVIDSVYGTLAITPEYTRSFRHNNISRCLFGDNLVDCNDDLALTISGSRTTNRGEKDLLADYFYLPTDFKSTVTFKPVIDNFVIDFSFYLGLDAWTSGLYLCLDAPLTHTRWDLNMCEGIRNPGILADDPGYFLETSLDRNRLLENFTAFVNGNSIANADFSDTVFQQLRFAKISDETKEDKTRLADLRIRFGWDFYQSSTAYAGINFQVAAPIGNRPRANFLFEPIVGNGHHWELGFGLNGRYGFWQQTDEECQASLIFDASITHLFKAKQKRTFDLANNGTLSRYMLVEKLDTPVNNNLKGDGTPAVAQFKKEFAPVANISTLDVNVSAAIQADIVLMLNLTAGSLSWDLGYNFWGRSCEKVRIRSADIIVEPDTWAIKGDAHVFGFVGTTQEAVALSATQSKATIHAGKNFPANGTTDPDEITAGKKNPNIDLPKPATGNDSMEGTDVLLLFAPGANNSAENQINTSIQPIFLTEDDIKVNTALSRGLSNKIFTHFSYTWPKQTDNWIPYLGIGGEVEFAQHDKQASSPCHSCPSCSISQWGAWIKGGFSFG